MIENALERLAASGGALEFWSQAASNDPSPIEVEAIVAALKVCVSYYLEDVDYLEFAIDQAS